MAGLFLARATDALDDRLGLGEAIGGMVLLAIAGTLPELAITVSATASGNLDVAAGNLLGGIAIQTLVLAMCDFSLTGKRPLSYLVGSLLPILEGAMVVAVLAVVLMGAVLPTSDAIAGTVSPASIAIVVVWAFGLMVLNQSRKAPRWEMVMEGSEPGRAHRRIEHPESPKPYVRSKTLMIGLIFLAAAGVTLAAGVLLETSGNVLADRAGMNGVIFGATFLAIPSALPEISSGLTAVRMGDNQLAMADILGGNSFQVCLFLVADLVAGQPVLPEIGVPNAWLASLGILITIVYAMAVLLRPERRYLRLGPDSILAIGIYAVGLVGLVEISS